MKKLGVVLLWLLVPFLALFYGSFTQASSASGEADTLKYTKHGRTVEISPAAWPSPISESSSLIPQSGLSTGFEAAEGFIAGMHCLQNGWSRFASGDAEGHIDTANPANGAQHVRISFDPGKPVGVPTGCFSPDLGVQPSLPMTATVNLAISATGGADYDFVAQAPSQEAFTAYMKFSYLGDILILGRNASDQLVFFDSGVDWDVGVYRPVSMIVDGNAGVILYLYNNAIVFMGPVFAGDSIEQIVLVSDNYHQGDLGDFDDVSITSTVSSPPPDAPSNLTATAASASRIDLSWQDNASDETAYYIERSTDGGNWSPLNTVAANMTSYSDTQLACDNRYYYRVRAYRAGDDKYSGYSDPADANTQACAASAAPSNLTATAVSRSRIDLSWLDNSADETDFHIERSPDGGSWSALTTVAANTTDYSDTQLACNSRYYYRVRAYRAGDGQYSSYSNVADSTTLACSFGIFLPTVQKPIPPPATPTLNQIPNFDQDGNYTVSWNSVGQVTYTLQEDDNNQFSSPAVAYQGSNTSWAATGKAPGVYYYRVKAAHTAGESAWSNAVSVVVGTPDPNQPRPGHYTGGSPQVSFDVTADQRVTSFRMTIPFGAESCRITPDAVSIVDRKFEFKFYNEDFGIDDWVRGTFDSPTHVTGEYHITLCGNILVIPPATGSWDATQQ